MAFYQSFTSLRTTEPDASSLFNQLRSADATAGLQHQTGTQIYVVKKSTSWTATQINTVQNMIDTAPIASLELTAQSNIDNWPIELKALALTLLDQINIIRAALPTPLAAITPAQAITAIRNKAGTL